MSLRAAPPEVANSIRRVREIEYAKLNYITEMLAELRMLCEDLDEQTLHYLIEMALLESSQRLEQHKYQNESK